MRPAIDLDRQTRLVRREVGVVAADLNLTAEMVMEGVGRVAGERNRRETGRNDRT